MRVHEGRIRVQAPYTLKTCCTNVPGARWCKTEKEWSYETTPATAQALLDSFRDKARCRADQSFRELVTQARTNRETAAIKYQTDLPPIPLTKTKPWLHQLQCYHWAYNMSAAMLSLDMGEQPLDEPVLTPTGWRPIGDLQVGDEVIGADGRPTEVLEIKSFKSRPVWVVATADGGSTRCSPTHLWTVRGERPGVAHDWHTITTKKLSESLSLPRWHRRCYIPGFRSDIRHIASITDTGTTAPMRCIRVANGDGLYVTKDYIVTHNTGKSKVTVDLIVNWGARRSLILAPLSVIQEWPRQFKTHAGAPVICAPLDDKVGSVKDKVVEAKLALHRGSIENIPAVIAINYESAWHPPFGPVVEEEKDADGRPTGHHKIIDPGWAMGIDWDVIVCDEVHRIQSHSGRASKFAAQLGKKAKRRLGLTGTPFSSGPLSVFGQYRFLDSGIFGSTWTPFRRRYAECNGPHPNQVTGYQNEDELRQKFYSIAFRVESRDVLDLPDEMHLRRYCQLKGAARKAYDELQDQFVTQLHQGEVTATNALTKLLRLQQVTSGFVRLDDTDEEEGKVVRVDHTKETLLEEILDGIPTREPVVIFGRFVHDLDVMRAVCEKQGRRYMELSGRSKQTEEWRSGNGDVLGVQLRAGGVGIDLTRAAYCVYFSMGFSLADYQQSLARTMRPGQKRNVTYLHLISSGTVDEKVYAALEKKKNVVDSILSDLR